VPNPQLPAFLRVHARLMGSRPRQKAQANYPELVELRSQGRHGSFGLEDPGKIKETVRAAFAGLPF